MAYYGLTIFLSAFLLFQIQPLIGKYILPWFGGTPAVWSASMLFFQVVLLLGYAYAYWLADRPDRRKQAIIHLVLLGVSLGALLVAGLVWETPITPGAAWKPSNADWPVWHILSILALAVGLPYLVLSTNASLMQVWFGWGYPDRSPYRLYALSNVGSLLALVSYPFLIEPALPLKMQANVWSLGYVIFALSVGYGAVKIMRLKLAPADAVSSSKVGRPNQIEARPSIRLRVVWLALAACASVLLLAVTNQISQEVAVIPFLWVLPLALYLLSFVVCFSGERWYSRTGYTIALLIGSVLFYWVFLIDPHVGLPVQIGIYCVLLFVCCMICHGELAHLKPVPAYLTSFYLMVAAGGALGGIFVGLIAPIIFTGFWELELGVLGCWVFLYAMYMVQRRPGQNRWLAQLAEIFFICGIGVVAATLFWHVFWRSVDAVQASRNFYGVLRVKERSASNPEDRAYQLTHGNTLHGFQFQAADRRRETTAYYTEESGVGLALLNYPRQGQGLRVGVVGLGIGTLAAYGQPGDEFRFYEINPDVIHLAEGQGGYFTYLSDSPAHIEVVPGDARVSLERELAAGQAQRFDVLVLDAFSSDAIPVHLLTREAFDIYLQHVQPDGIMALHITSRYLDLWPVVKKQAYHFQLRAALIESSGDETGARISRSAWVLLGRDADFLQQPEIASRASPTGRQTDARQPDNLRLWTDDYSNLFQILK